MGSVGTIRIDSSSLLLRLPRPSRHPPVPNRKGRTNTPSDWVLQILTLRIGSGTCKVTNGTVQTFKDRRPDSSISIRLPVPAPRGSRRKLIHSSAPIRIRTSMDWVRGCGISCTTPCQRRGRGVGYLLCLNQVTHPPTRTSRLDPLIPWSIATLTTWETLLLTLALVTMDVCRVGWDRTWVIGGSGVKTRMRTRWKLVSLGFCISSLFRDPLRLFYPTLVSRTPEFFGRSLCGRTGIAFGLLT